MRGATASFNRPARLARNICKWAILRLLAPGRLGCAAASPPAELVIADQQHHPKGAYKHPRIHPKD